MYTHLEGLNEGPQEDADGVSLSQQLNETSRSEEPQEAQIDHFVLGHKTDTFSILGNFSKYKTRKLNILQQIDFAIKHTHALEYFHFRFCCLIPEDDF